MKLNILKNTATGAGSLKKIKFTIDSENMGMVYQSFLNYSNPVGSIVREIASNAYDSHIEAGIEESIQIEIKDANRVTDEPGQLIITDFGVGLSPQRVEDIYSKFFSSTKRDTNDEIGGFGIGAKSPLSYTDIFTVVTNYENVEYTYLVSRGELSPEIELFSEEDTDKSNGTSVIIPINDGDMYKVRSEIKNQLKYFDNVNYINCGIESNYNVVRSNKGFIFNTNYLTTNTRDQTDICIGQVRYPIDYTALNLGSWNYNIPIAIHFDIGELPVVWNREAITYTKEAIDLIKNRLESVYEYLKELAKEQGNYTDLDEFFEALSLNSLDNNISTVRLGTHVVPIPNLSFRVSCAIPTSDGTTIHVSPNLWAKRWEHHGYVVNGKVKNSARHRFKGLTYYKFKEDTLTPTINKYLSYANSGKTITIMVPATAEHNLDLLINSVQGYSNLWHDNRPEADSIKILIFDTMFKYMKDEYEYYGDIKPTQEFFDHLEAVKKAKKSDKTTLADVGDYEIILHFYNKYSHVFSPHNAKLSYFYKRFTTNRKTFIWGGMGDKELIKQIFNTLSACDKQDNYTFFVVGKSTEDYMPKDLHNVINVHKFAKSKKMYTIMQTIQESYYIDKYTTTINDDFIYLEPKLAKYLTNVSNEHLKKRVNLATYKLPSAIREKLRNEDYPMSWAKWHDETVKGLYIKYPLLRYLSSCHNVSKSPDAQKELQEYIESKDGMNPRYYYLREQQKQLKISENDKNTVQS